MKIETAIKKVVAFLQDNPASTKEAIGTATKVKGIELTNVIKVLRKKEFLIEDGEAKELKFSLNAEASTEPEPVLAATGEQTEPVVTAKLKKGRNNDKYQFNGNAYGKGPLVLEVVRQYVAGHPKVTFKQLKEVFPDELLKRFGIFQEESVARGLSSSGRDRFFLKDTQLLRLGDRKIVAVSNQHSQQTIIPFLAAAKKAGFKIK